MSKASRYKRVKEYRTQNIFSHSAPVMFKDDMTLEMFLREIDPSRQTWSAYYTNLRVAIDYPPKPPHPWPGE